MRNQETIKIGEKEITVRELTVREIDRIFATFAVNRPPSMAERLIDSTIPIEVVMAATGISNEDLDVNHTPAELNKIWAATGRVNDFLSKMISNHEKILGQLMTELPSPGSDGSSVG